MTAFWPQRLWEHTLPASSVEEQDATSSPYWSWARLLKRVHALALARCPFCRQGALRMLAALIQAEVIRSILRQILSPQPILPILPAV